MYLTFHFCNFSVVFFSDFSSFHNVYDKMIDNVGLIRGCCDCQALAEAIQSVTEMNQDLAVEKIEIETATDLEVNGPK